MTVRLTEQRFLLQLIDPPIPVLYKRLPLWGTIVDYENPNYATLEEIGRAHV